MEFWKTKIGKIFNYGIHEHNSGLGYISSSKHYIQYCIDNKLLEITFKDDKIKEGFNNSLERIINGKNKCKESLDYIYTKIKEEEGY